MTKKFSNSNDVRNN